MSAAQRPMLDGRGDVAPSLESCISVNVDGSESESEDVSPPGEPSTGGIVLAESEVQAEHDDAETASIHSESTDGGKKLVGSDT